jgi:YbbR domain-containing protein
MNTVKRFLAGITEQWPVKVLSVVVAIILFVFHRMGDLQERFISVPLKLELSGGLVPSIPYPRNIRVTLRGDANSIFPVAESDIEAYLDLSAYREPGIYKAPVQIRKKGTALEVVSIEIGVDPAEISVELDVKTSKTVPVVPDFQGTTPENGFELVDYVLEPNRMVIDGPLHMIGSVVELNTDSVDLRNRTMDFTLQLQVVSPDPLITIRGDGITEFRAFVGESIMIRSFDNLPIGITGMGEGLHAEIEPAKGTARLEGVQRIIESFEPPENFLSVDLSGIEHAGIYTLPVRAVLSEDFMLLDQTPLETVVRINPLREEEQ